MLKNQINEFIPNLNKKIKDNIGGVIDEIKERIGGGIEIKIPNLKIDKDGKIVGNHLEEALETKTEKLRKLKEQEGFWGTIKRFFDWGDNEWGQDAYYVDNQYFEITKTELDEKINEVFKKVSSSIKQTINEIFEKQIKKEVTDSINRLIKEIENYRYEMMDVIKKAKADAFDKEKAIASVKEYQEISIRLNERIEKVFLYLEKIK